MEKSSFSHHQIAMHDSELAARFLHFHSLGTRLQCFCFSTHPRHAIGCSKSIARHGNKVSLGSDGLRLKTIPSCMVRSTRRDGPSKAQVDPSSVWSKLHVQLTSEEIQADLDALALHPAPLPANEAAAGVRVLVEQVDAAAMPAAPLQESWFPLPPSGSRGHPEKAPWQRGAPVWPPQPAQQAALAAVRPHRSTRKPARFEEESPQQQPGSSLRVLSRGHHVLSQVTRDSQNAATSPPHPGLPSPLAEPPAQQCPAAYVQPVPAWQPAHRDAVAAAPPTPQLQWPASQAALQQQPDASKQTVTGSMAGSVDANAALDQGLLQELPPALPAHSWHPAQHASFGALAVGSVPQPEPHAAGNPLSSLTREQWHAVLQLLLSYSR